jgi:hypothetical protein
MNADQLVTLTQINFALCAAQFVVIIVGLIFAIKMRKETTRMIEWMKFYRGERKDPPT